MEKINKYSEVNQPILISLGDPAGIGIEVTLKALGSLDLPSKIEPILVGCKKSLALIYSQLHAKGITPLANPSKFKIEDIPFRGNLDPGNPSSQTGEASFQWLTHATKLLIQEKGHALVTAPIAKYSWHEAGYYYPGQTERLAELVGSNSASMLFTAISPHNGWRLNTLLATTHIPFSEISKKLCPELINSKLDTLLKFCQRFKSNPRLSVAGLNPHAGEKGRLGKEEIEWLIPTLNDWQKKHPSIPLEGPISPDSCWVSAAKAWQGLPNKMTPDGILALYHDQGLIPVKSIAFDEAVNTTLGLPFIRTSPDHGTGFDIAGMGCARPTSMLAAIKTAWELTKT